MSLEISSKRKVYENFEEGTPITGAIVGSRLIKDVTIVWKGKSKVVDKVQVKILTDVLDSKKERMTALFSATASMHEKSSLRKFIRGVIGRDPGDTYDVDLLDGKCADFVFTNNENKDGRIFSNITGVQKATHKVTIPADFEAFYLEEDAKPEHRRQVATEVKSTPVTSEADEAEEVVEEF
jgi:hypothetical protein